MSTRSSSEAFAWFLAASSKNKLNASIAGLAVLCFCINWVASARKAAAWSLVDSSMLEIWKKQTEAPWSFSLGSNAIIVSKSSIIVLERTVLPYPGFPIASRLIIRTEHLKSYRPCKIRMRSFQEVSGPTGLI